MIPGLVTPNGGGAAGGAGIFPSWVFPLDPRAIRSTAAPNANNAYGCRVVIPKTGILNDLSIFIGTSNGNIDLGVYSTAGTRARLWSSGSTPCPAAGAWRNVGDPGILVTAGDELDFAVSTDSATAAFATNLETSPVAGVQLPAEFLTPGGALPKLAWFKSGSAFPLPATLAEAGLAADVNTVLIGGRIV